MRRKIASVSNWLLKNSRDIVKKLERDAEMFVMLGDSERLELKKVRLFVPQGIEVYHVIANFRNKGELFFTTKGNNDFAQTYCSYINTEPGGALNYMKNVGKLLEYPWYSRVHSSRIFDRLLSAGEKTNLYLIDCDQQTGNHPFSRK